MSSKNMAYSIAIMGLLYNNPCLADVLPDRLTAFKDALHMLSRAFSPTSAPELKAQLDAIIEQNFKPKIDVDEDKIDEYQTILNAYQVATRNPGPDWDPGAGAYYVAWGHFALAQYFYDEYDGKSRPEIMKDVGYDY